MLRPISLGRPHSRGLGRQPSFLRPRSGRCVDRQSWLNKKGRGFTDLVPAALAFPGRLAVAFALATLQAVGFFLPWGGDTGPGHLPGPSPAGRQAKSLVRVNRVLSAGGPEILCPSVEAKVEEEGEEEG